MCDSASCICALALRYAFLEAAGFHGIGTERVSFPNNRKSGAEFRHSCPRSGCQI
jgi:hypothetical protein